MMDAEPCPACGADGDAGCTCPPGRVAPFRYISASVYEARPSPHDCVSLAVLHADVGRGWLARNQGLARFPLAAFTTTPAGRLVLVTP
jgi:hypothetical protein